MSDPTSGTAPAPPDQPPRGTDLAHIRAVADLLPQLVWACRPDGHCEYLSRRWVAYTGVPEAGHHGAGWLTAVHPDDRERTRAGWLAFVAGTGAYDVDYRLRRHDGAYRWFKTRGVLLRDDRGAPVRVVGTTTDIDAQKRAEETSTVILESISDAFFALGRDWAFTYVNREAERLLGRTRADLAGKSIWVEFAPALGTAFERGYRRAAAENVAVAFEAFYPPHDRWYEVNVYPSAAGLSVYFRDVNDRRRAADRERRAAADAARAAEANAKFRALFEQSALFAGLLAPDGTAVEVNRLALDSCGFARADVVGKPFWECGWWSPSAALRDAIRGACRDAAAGRPFRAELPYFVADGSPRVVDLVIAPVTDDAGRVLFLAPTGTDVTDRARAEAAAADSEGRYRTLFTSMAQGFCVVEVLFDGGRAADYRFLEVNPAFEAHTGLAGAAGRTARELAPALEGFWFEAYGRVAATGEPARFEHRAAALGGRWFDVHAFRVGPAGARRVAVLFTDVTARRAAEDAVRANEAWLQTVSDSLPALVSYVDAALVYRFVNRAYEEWFGTPAAAVVGRPVRAVLGEENFAQRRPHLEAALRGEAVRFEGPTRHAALGVRQTDIVYTPHRVGGAVAGFFVHGVDVTARRDAEHARRETERRLELAVEIAQMGTFEIDLATDAVTVNEPGRAIYGWPDARTTFAAVQAHFHPDDRAEVMRQVAGALDPAGPGAFELEQRIVRADGAVRWIRVRARALFDGDGAARCVGAFLDVTDRKRAEEALRDSERRFREMADTAPVALWLTGPDGCCTFLSREWYEFTGQTEAEALGLGWADATHPDDREAAGRAFLSANAARTTFRTEYRLRTRDGAYRWAIDAGRPRLSPAGDYLGMVGAVFDIEDRKQAEQSLREADRRKDEFLALLAHELRNPLAPLRNGLQVMRLATDPARVARARDMMDRQLGHMVRLIDDLLDVSRISRNKLELRRARVALADVVASAVETARPALDAAGVRLRVALPPEPLHLDADLTRLAQVFGNLLANAAKFTDPGGHVWLSAAARPGEAAVSVRDTGIGIPAEALPTIFDMFSQVDRSIERSRGGLGIGLALVRGLVEMHGGRVAADSPGPGAGSTFTVSLPLAGSAAQGAAAPAAAPAGPPRRVLVVDDNQDSAASMAAMLELLGHTVETAHDGVAAVGAAEAFRPDVILMDVGMPLLNGYDATRRIRERAWAAGVTIVAVTGWGQAGDRAQSKLAGCDGHLVKPVHLNDLAHYLVPGG